MRLLIVALTVAVLAPRPAQAQSIAIYGSADDAAVAVLEGIFERDDFVLIDRDTVLGPAVSIAGDVVVARARVSVEGRIAGSVAVLDGELFVWPGGTVDGSVAVLGSGGAFPSGLATAGPVIEQDPRVFVSVGRTATGYSVTISPRPEPPTLRLPGLFGFTVPTYDRVNGVSPRWGGIAGFGGGDTATVALRGSVAYRALRSSVDGTAEASYRPTPRTLISLRAGRETQTPDSWIRSDLANTLSTLVKGSDVRDYFESDVAAFTVRRLPPPPIVPGEAFIVPGLTFRASRDRSLRAENPWSLMGDDDWRPNPPIDEGTLASIVARADLGWRAEIAALEAAAALEWAPAGVGDLTFAQLASTFTWTADAIANHRIGVTGYGLIPIGRREAPLQRWSHVGGPGTLPTFPTAFQRGDHVGYVNVAYLVPITRIRLPLAGTPLIRLEYMAGAAWRTGDPVPTPLQNAGAGIQFLVFKAMYFVDPASGFSEGTISFGTQISGPIRLPTF